MTPGLSSASVTDAPDICYQQSLESENGVDRSQPGPARFIMVATELLIKRVAHRHQLVD